MKRNFKMPLDILMTVGMILLMNLFVTGVLLHEILGLFLFLLIIIHNLLNYQWIRAVTRNFFRPAIRTKTRIMYFLNLLLFISMAVTMVTGILISKELFQFSLEGNQTRLASALHKSTAYISLILISIHIGMHWSTIMTKVRKGLHLNQESRVRTIAARAVAVLIMLMGIKSSADKDVIGNVVSPFTSQNTSSTEPRIGNFQKGSRPSLDAANTTATSTSSPSLEEYLSGLNCTGCHRHCPLSSPQCGIGDQQAAEAETSYYSQNGSSDSQVQGNAGGTLDNTIPDGNETGNRKENRDSGSALSALSFIPIMGLFVGGTHYTVVLAEKFKRKEPLALPAETEKNE